MEPSVTLASLLVRLFNHISVKRRKQLVLLSILMVFTSFVEVITIGAVLPFLGVLTAPDQLFEYPAVQPIIQMLGLSTPEDLLLPFTIAFGMAALLAGCMRLILLWASMRLTYATGHELSISIYKRTLYQSYALHTSRNSSEIINGVTAKTNSTIGVIMMVLTLIGAVVMLSFILVALFYLDPSVACAVFGGFGIIYGVIAWITRAQLINNSQQISIQSTQLIKTLQEGLGGIRDILIDGSQAVYCQVYREADLPLRRAQGNINIIGGSPKFIIEALGMMLISWFAYFLSTGPDGIIASIPILGAMALGAQRLLPTLQQGYVAWSSINGTKASLEDTIDLLDQPLPEYIDQAPEKQLPFNNEIKLKKLGFQYGPKLPLVVSDITLTIPKGGRVGFIGTTGSGKSTVLDIIMGLLQASEGSIEVDGTRISDDNKREWQSHIAHVPQSIFLSDCSIEENIAFGIAKDDIDLERVRRAAEQAQIADIIETFPKKYKTSVGERGVQLSGGQRQRIGIARALYKKADVIIFDEATSALDAETEAAVMQAIEGLSQDLTILIIAHRITTLKNCSQIVELIGGGVVRLASYQTVLNQLETVRTSKS